MANDLNQCNFIGRLGKDPESRFMPSGEQVVSFSLAVGWKGKSAEGTEWVNITAFGKLAEICAEYLQKGSQVYISGKMKTRKYQDKSGSDRYVTEIVADQMQMLGSKSDSQRTAPAQQQQAAPPQQSNKFEEDDIPF